MQRNARTAAFSAGRDGLRAFFAQPPTTHSPAFQPRDISKLRRSPPTPEEERLLKTPRTGEPDPIILLTNDGFDQGGEDND